MARIEKVVVDASVLIKWYNLEDDSEKALQLRTDYASRRVELVAPYLITYEIANSLRYNPDFGAEDVKSAITDLINMQLSLQPPDVTQMQRATDLAFRYGITIYDAAYLALAEMSEIPFYTADEKLVLKAAEARIRHIHEYGNS